VALLDVFTDNFAVIGKRDGNDGGGRVAIVGPGWTGALDDGSRIVRSTTNDAWLIVRLRVDGTEYIAQARPVQAGLLVAGPRLTAGATLFLDPLEGELKANAMPAVLDQIVMRGPLPREKLKWLRRCPTSGATAEAQFAVG